MLETLPIDAKLPEIVESLRGAPALVISAPPGAGKTTRVPWALCEAGFAKTGEILVLEPRRIAARLAAQRIADELGETLGRTVGFSIRWETIDSPLTRIRFVTEGVLSRRIVRDPLLAGTAAVILDEFHERHIQTDLALAFLRQLQLTRRPDLKLVAMSATLDAGPVAEFLGEARIVFCEGARFETVIEHETRPSDRPLQEKIARAVSTLVNSGVDGDILVFLPGAMEIRRTGEALEKLAAAAGITIIPLHGDLPVAEQARAVQPHPRRKIILATNVAETSITIPGIAAVVDSGLARVAGHSPWSGLPLTAIKGVSKASATQRAGRAGRTRAGRVLRLYTRADFESRPEHEVPEIKRADLAETLLTLHGAGIESPRDFPWFEPPPGASLDAAEELLGRLGALDSGGKITPVGKRMLIFPVHPRLARLIVEGERLGVARGACTLAALLSERDIRQEARSELHGRGRRPMTRALANSDLAELLDCFNEAEADRFEPARLSRLGLDPRAVQNVDRARRQLTRLAAAGRRAPADETEEALRIAILSAFPDRVARRRQRGARELVLSGGGEALLSDSSVVHDAMLLVAADAEQRSIGSTSRTNPAVIVRLASAIEPEWLVAMFPDSISEAVEAYWNHAAGRVDEARRTYYGELILEESIRPAPPSREATRLLAGAALAQGTVIFRDGDVLPALQARLFLLAQNFPDVGFPELGASEVKDAIEAICVGRQSLAELGKVSLVETLVGRLTRRQRELLEREAPERVGLHGGRKVRVHYASGKPPWIESRLQDLFGMNSTPRICEGRVPLTVHLLAPSGRPVQVTQDLAGFWVNHYPSIRRELRRRYPKHAWPEL